MKNQINNLDYNKLISQKLLVPKLFILFSFFNEQKVSKATPLVKAPPSLSPTLLSKQPSYQNQKINTHISLEKPWTNILWFAFTRL